MRLSDFDFDLDPARIAVEPAEPRDHSRLLVVDRKTGAIFHRHFYDLPSLLTPGDLLVVNNSKVLPARLFAKSAGEGKVEILLLRAETAQPLVWKCLVRPGKRVKEEETPLTLPDGSVAQARRDEDDFFIRFSHVPNGEDLLRWLELHGHPPLPPYIQREAGPRDRERYQTVYAKTPGSVAAPTAGLHFTPKVLAELAARGVGRAEVTLHVGYGTFSPVKEDDLEKHVMHEESFSVPSDLTELTRTTRARGGRVIAVGTTALRALESMEDRGMVGETRLFIRPGYRFRQIDGLVTNFHLPKSTLFILVASLLGLEKTKECYETAIREGYRFYSYGDAMLIL